MFIMDEKAENIRNKTYNKKPNGNSGAKACNIWNKSSLNRHNNEQKGQKKESLRHESYSAEIIYSVGQNSLEIQKPMGYCNNI